MFKLRVQNLTMAGIQLNFCLCNFCLAGGSNSCQGRVGDSVAEGQKEHLVRHPDGSGQCCICSQAFARYRDGKRHLWIKHKVPAEKIIIVGPLS